MHQMLPQKCPSIRRHEARKLFLGFIKVITQKGTKKVTPATKEKFVTVEEKVLNFENDITKVSQLRSSFKIFRESFSYSLEYLKGGGIDLNKGK